VYQDSIAAVFVGSVIVVVFGLGGQENNVFLIFSAVAGRMIRARTGSVAHPWLSSGHFRGGGTKVFHTLFQSKGGL
jgi:hypothetical protein